MENVKIIKRFLAPLPSGQGHCYSYGDSTISGHGADDGSGGVYGRNGGSGFGYGPASGLYNCDDDSGSAFGYRLKERGNGDSEGYGDSEAYLYNEHSVDNIKSLNGQPVWYIDNLPTLIDSVYDNRYALGAIVNSDLTTKKCYIARVGNSFAHGKTLHDALRDAEKKEFKDTPLKERIDRFVKAYPNPDALHPCRELYNWHHTLTGSCTLGRDNFVREHGLDMDSSYSVRYFIEITAHAYGGKAISQLAERYGIPVQKI